MLPTLALLVPFFLWPLTRVVGQSVTEPELGLHNYSATLGSEAVAVVMTTTIRIALGTTLVCLLLGLPYAHYAARASKRKAMLLLAVSTAPLTRSACESPATLKLAPLNAASASKVFVRSAHDT